MRWPLLSMTAGVASQDRSTEGCAVSLEIRPSTGTDRQFDLYDGDDLIGEITHDPPADEFAWGVTVWSIDNHRESWSDCAGSLREARDLAHTFYGQLTEHLRQQSRGSVRAISTPMGGQRRR